jgi:hypothetical protein
MSEAWRKLAELREKYRSDDSARQRAAEQLIEELRKAARAALCNVEPIDDGVAVSIPGRRPAVSVTLIDGAIYILAALKAGPVQKRFDGLKWDPLGRTFTARQGSDSSPADALIDGVTELLEALNKEVDEQTRQSRR